MTKIWSFLNGKKTYIGAALLLLVAVAGFWYGQLDATGAGVIAGFAFSIAGLGHKAQKYAELLIAQTDALKKSGHIDTKSLISAAVNEAVDRATGANSSGIEAAAAVLRGPSTK